MHIDRPNGKSTIPEQRVLRDAICTQQENQVGDNRLDAIAIVAAVQAKGTIFSADYNNSIVQVPDELAVLFVLQKMRSLRMKT
jgi:hypothetical protein